MFRVRHIAFSLAILGVAASLPIDLAHARGHALKRHTHSASLGRKPARWCGWWMRTQKGGGPEMDLARNWAHWGRPSGPRAAPWWFGLTMSASSPGKLLAANGSCARAMTVDGCARGPAQWPAPCSASNKA
jgi:hypothetical protein